MTTAEFNALHIVHVFSVIALVGTVFYACAGKPETRKKVLMLSGIASLLVLLTGIRMWQGLPHVANGWVAVKAVCWLGLSGFVGIAYRRRAQAGLWVFLALVLTLIALVMVYTKPF